MAFNYDAPNKPSAAAIAAADPNVEDPTNPGVVGSDGTGAMAATCNPGVGIASAVPDPKATDWAREARGNTEPGQYIGWGGDNAIPGQEDADIPPLKVVDYATPDVNDTWRWVQATSAANGAAKGQTIATGVVTASAVPVAIGEWIWGKVVVAGAQTLDVSALLAYLIDQEWDAVLTQQGTVLFTIDETTLEATVEFILSFNWPGVPEPLQNDIRDGLAQQGIYPPA